MQERVSNEDIRIAMRLNPILEPFLLDLLDCRKELTKVRDEAWRLVQTLNAYDGGGIPQSDASDAFTFLRKIAACAAKDKSDV